MGSQYRSAYRSILREVAKSSISTRNKRNQTVAANVRVIFENHRDITVQPTLRRDLDNAVTFLRSYRLHKALLERYNPLHDLTTEERTKATARRVGLDMPVDYEPES